MVEITFQLTDIVHELQSNKNLAINQKKLHINKSSFCIHAAREQVCQIPSAVCLRKNSRDMCMFDHIRQKIVSNVFPVQYL